MEIQLLASLLLAALFVSSAVQLLTKIASTSNTTPRPALPPGPWKLPLLGSMHHLAAALPHRALARLSRVHGPVMHLQVGQVGLVVASSREAASEVMKVQDAAFAHRPALAAATVISYGCTGIAFSSGAHWRQLRKLCVTELLSPRRVKAFAPLRQEEMHALLRQVAGAPHGAPLDLSHELTCLANAVVCRAAFGDRFRHQRKFLPLMKEAIEVSSGFSASDVFPSLRFLDVGMRLRLRRMRREMDEILDDVIQERLRQRRQEGEEKDLLDVLLKAREQEDLEVPISYDSIKAVLLDIFAAGTETSSSMIVWMMAELIKNPREMAKVTVEIRSALNGKTKLEESDIVELSYLKLVVKETLRLHPPVPLLLPRVCHEQCELFGYAIPAGTRVIVNSWALGRDQRYWEHAESFLPERFLGSTVDYKGNNYEFVPFGAGRRMCPGMAFGLASVEFGLALLLLHFDWELLKGMQPEDLDMTETFGATAARKEPLVLVPKLRIPVPEL